MIRCCVVPLYTTGPIHFQLRLFYESTWTENTDSCPPQVSYSKTFQMKEEKYYDLMKIKILRKFIKHELYLLNGQLS